MNKLQERGYNPIKGTRFAGGLPGAFLGLDFFSNKKVQKIISRALRSIQEALPRPVENLLKIDFYALEDPLTEKPYGLGGARFKTADGRVSGEIAYVPSFNFGGGQTPGTVQLAMNFDESPERGSYLRQIYQRLQDAADSFSSVGYPLLSRLNRRFR